MATNRMQPPNFNPDGSQNPQYGYPSNGPYDQGLNNQIGDPFINDTTANALKFIKNPFISNMIYNSYQQHIPQFSFANYIFTTKIKGYFNISNDYVRKKLRMILFPFSKQDDDTKKDNEEFMEVNAGAYNCKSLNSPDLYIPLMSLMTFILLICFTRGMGNEFEPDLIAYYTTNCLLACMFEIFLYKIVLILVNVQSLSILDLICMVNYKYFGLCIAVIGNLIGVFTFFIQLYISLAIVLFMYNFLKNYTQASPSVASIGTKLVPTQYVLYFLSGFQFLTFWLLARLTSS